MIVFQEWMNANEQRNYPLHTLATRMDKNGKELPNDAIVDGQLWLPRSAGRLAYISSFGLTSKLVTLTILATDDNPFCPISSTSAQFVPLAVLSVVRPIVRYKPYQVTPLYPGVGGWFAFGGRCELDEPLTLLFDEPEATILTDRAVRAYNDVPVLSLGKEGSATELTGLVRLKGEAGAVITRKEQRIIGGSVKDVAVIALDLTTNGVETLQDLAGTCGHRPQARNCNKAPIVSINDVLPDDVGNIDIEFEGDAVVGDVQEGMILDYPVSLAEVCPPIDPNRLFIEPPGPTSSSSTPSESSSSVSSEQPSSSESASPFYCEDFEAVGAPEELTQRKPELLPPYVFGFTIQNVGAGKRYVSQPGLPGAEQFSIDLHRKLNPSTPYRISGILYPRTVATGEGHLIYAYKTDINFLFAGLTLKPVYDPSGIYYPDGAFFVGRRLATGSSSLGSFYNFFTGSVFAPPFPLIQTDYRLTVEVSQIGINYLTRIYAQWCDPVHGEQLLDETFVHPIAIPSGYAGLGVINSETEFDRFGIDCPDYESSSSSYCP